ncbi:hypothetical protein [Roseomonas elaeocarpi]|uniref:Uncharacterized protein n=1 Tax=Roseomonas elaeocarpi TaxID=907779 RepID=A0ABV6JRE0_9PROT
MTTEPTLEEQWQAYAATTYAGHDLDENNLTWLRMAWMAGADTVIRGLVASGPEAMVDQLMRWDAEMVDEAVKRFNAATEPPEA